MQISSNFLQLIEQQSLAQSRKTALLTLMASLFIPMGFVAVSHLPGHHEF